MGCKKQSSWTFAHCFLRSSEAEGAFGDIKKNFGYSLLRRRGESGVRVELGLVILGYNLRHYHRQRTKLMK
ncbi:transposase [Holdemania filiformis]|uniref:transposase n=1 Tax=Holdemania filiformis TaxID=61171 RepID=UPI00242B2FDF|nr:transposase [Holdemania filiformis]